MKLYNGFAYVYARGNYANYSKEMAELLPGLLKQYKIPVTGSRKLLDLASGEGTFAVEMAKKGWHVSGVDLSDEMLRLASHRARKENVSVDFQKKDMRFIDSSDQYNLVTCWFGSLNYLVSTDDLQSTFNSVARSLAPNGWFLFDMNTLHGLAITWQEQPCRIQNETKDLLELHCINFNFENNIATRRVTWFIKVEALWERFEEMHTIRGYTISEITSCLEYAGLTVVDTLGDLDPVTPLAPDSDRVWFLVRK